MTVRALDPATGDIVTSGQQFISDIDEIAQTISTRLKLFLGEYFRDITDGTPWFQEILGKHVSLSRSDAALRSRIAETSGVIKLLAFKTDFDPNTRQYTVYVSVKTEYGDINGLQVESVV